MVAFDSSAAPRRCRVTVSRSTPSSRAIRRRDQPRRRNVMMVSMRAILSRFAMFSLRTLWVSFGV
jgi:hypothetical protein